MGDKIYERILKNSKDGFLKIKGYKNKNGEYIGFDIIEYNNSLIEILKKILAKSNLNIDNIKEAFSKKFDDNNQKIKFEEFLKIVEKNEFKNVSFGKI